MVDRNVVEGTIENLGGKVEEAAGYVTGDPGARVEGRVRQVAGKAQAAYGKGGCSAVDRRRPGIGLSLR